ncbi:Transglutaminase-like superfamily protein [Anaerosporobacter mobilis DSM 15930]|uniref:Transglutaminase-like superfamily protein n=1 Tax=Anaerosporobacter mobilis DSM 15930 TaxID=1120996 RepID=A0A1M7N964_9FIRM|nr:Ig-like domain-containing protein [Anaerosporobacter mobilis]SHN00158.1 Transglutaminase-like superfamily protein [Anaerosporobacter mobilis DSM 15930]
MGNKLKKIIMFVFLVVSITNMSSALTVSAATIVGINKTTDYLVKGETTTLKVTGTSKKVTWSTDNKKIATVSTSGKVTAVACGTTTIKATVNKVTYKCKVTVVNPSKIYLDPSSSKVTVNGKAVSLNPTSDTYSAAAMKAMKLTYKVSGNTGVTVSSAGKVTATKAGSFKVTAYVHGKKIETVSMNAVLTKSSFPGFAVSEVNVEVEKYREVYFANNYLLAADDITVKSSDPSVATAEGAFSTLDLDHYYGIEIHGLKDGRTTLSVTINGVTKSIKVIVGQGINVLAPVDAVKANNFAGYSGNSLNTLQWTRQFIDSNNLDSDTLTDREKITIIQNYLNSTANKNTDNTYDGYISSIIFNGYYGGGDCEAYSTTFCFLCECINIEVLFCGGCSDNGDGTGYKGHAWNKVKVDGTWYYIDSYWNACLNSFDYFLSETLWSNHNLSDREDYYAEYGSTDNIPYVSEIK